jgi:hypothetical protein
MSLEQLSYLAQIVASLGVILSLIFVGLQIRQQTSELQRNEHNSTMAQWTAIRMAIVQHREIAELMTGGLEGKAALDTADRLRLDMLLNEYAWASFHIWDRTRRGVFPQGTFEISCSQFAELLKTPYGADWWRSAARWGLIPPFMADVDAMLAADAGEAGADDGR